MTAAAPAPQKSRVGVAGAAMGLGALGMGEAVLQASLDAIVITDDEGRVLEFNPAAELLFGHRRADTLGRKIGDLIVPAHFRAAHEQGMARYAAGNPARVVGKRLELEALHADGHVFPVELAIVEAGGAGERRFFAASLRDLSERRAQEAELHARQEFLRALVDDQSEMVIRSDPDYRILFCNEAVSRFFGLPREALIGSDFTPGTPEAVKARLRAELPHLRPEAPIHRSIDPKVMPDGSTRWLEWSNRAIFDAGGRLTGHVSVARDITEKLAAERALEQSEARFAAFVENAPVAMFLKDAAGRYVVLNGQACQVIGKPREDIIGRTAREVGTPGSADVTEAADAEVIARGAPMSSVVRLTQPGEPYHWAMILRFPVAAPDGNGTWIGGFAIDITAQRAAEADLERSREALHQSEKLNAMGSLLAGVAHELNNPLAIVVAQATMLEEDAKGGPLERRAEKIRAAGERCGRIVKTFLGLARRKPQEMRAADLNEMARAAVELMGYSLRTGGIAVEIDLAPDLPAVEGDADLLAQVVLNLLVNAQQALEGRPGPRLIRLATRAQGGQVVLDLGDSGPGVPDEIRARIFEPFFSTKPQGMGTGVGLSFCMNVVTAHQGRLELVAPDRALVGLGGAVFRVSLPVAGAVAGVAEPAPPETAAAGRALVVDDEPDVAEVLAEMLAQAGYAAEVAGSVAEARAKIGRNGAYAVIFSDLRMPEEDGPAFHAWLVEAHPALAARLAFVTGDALGAQALGFLDRAGRPCLEKPFTRDALSRVLAEVEKAAG